MKNQKKSKLLYDHNASWDWNTLRSIYSAVEEIAVDELHLDPYPAQMEIISSEQMLDAYSSIGLPMMYSHWSFGKNRLRDEHNYRKGYSGLALEIIINTNPCIGYYMEENTVTSQALTIAHAQFGHSHFFKNNYLFKQWTDASGIVDYLMFAKKFIRNCEEKYGLDVVERTLDAAHSLMDYGIDRYKRPPKLNSVEEHQKQKERQENVQQSANELWMRLTPKKQENKEKISKFPKEPQENILYFLEKHAPKLEGWQREILRIVRKLSIYYYPQSQTKILNEGTASYVHYYIMNRLWEKGQISDGSYLEFLHSHTSVVFQPKFNDKRFSGFNPYWLGFTILTDMQRVCEKPTKQDEEWFPDLVGKGFNPIFLDAIANYRDESFIRQFLSPKVMEESRMFHLTDDSKDDNYIVSSIHNERGYKKIRHALAESNSISNRQPEILIVDANITGNRTLKLRYNSYDGVLLDNQCEHVINYIEYLWGYPVELEINQINRK